MNRNGFMVRALAIAAICAAAAVGCTRKPVPPWAAVPVPAGSVFYMDNRYGFGIVLPASWKGYTVLSGTWTATIPPDNVTAETGPLFRLRHPL